MHKVTFLLAGLALSINAQATAPTGSLDLGQTCTNDKECKNGAKCYGTTSDTIRACGNFNAACDDDSQCAFNTCSSNGLCSGFLPLSSTSTASTSTSTSATPSIITGTAGSQPSGQAPITAPANSLNLGETCSDDAQCKNGANCYGTTAFTIRVCGNFNAACENDSQCAFNSCASNGLCSGFLATQASNGTSVTMTTSMAAPSSGFGGVSAGNGTAVASATGGVKPSASGVPFDSSASGIVRVSGGVVAALVGFVAFLV